MEPALRLGAGISKQEIREKIWDYMEAQNIADFPRPVHHRIPNFKGSYEACQNIRELDAYSRMQEVKVDPDKPLEGVRLMVLQGRKTLLVPTPRLRTGLFNKIVPPPGATKEILRRCATSQGVKNYSVPIGLDSRIIVDLIVVGSVAVSEKGWRIGKGEGYADMEYAMMVSMGAVREKTPVVTIVHDCQVVDVPEELLGDHDLTVDYILTPTRVIVTGCTRPKPQGIIWSMISEEMMGRIPILKNLHFREKQAGKDVTLQKEYLEHSKTSNKQAVLWKSDQIASTTLSELAGSAHLDHDPVALKNESSSSVTTVYVGNIPQDARVSDMKRTLREYNAVPLRLNWQGPQGRAFLDYKDQATAECVISSLKGLSFGGNSLWVKLAKKQKNK
ncbi:methenyltetrahydrofolate synthase domain-containing protein isoform X3 [Monodelphis domestica]|uniref:methenyltetrahydrofolate synthase domain-containing protein isoform X3 n=1 Tax=Monodelphis domestica TaxID=13616 RepID=UPI0007B41CCF|nr:methenyltetrahydrofolate synthase domain-containing protein isoform X3 [Monodelphis domestica]